MSQICQVTGKRSMNGNSRSHALNATKRRFLPNLHFHRFWVKSKGCFIVLRVSAKGIRMIDKKGIDAILSEMHSQVKNTNSLSSKEKNKPWLKAFAKKSN